MAEAVEAKAPRDGRLDFGPYRKYPFTSKTTLTAATLSF